MAQSGIMAGMRKNRQKKLSEQIRKAIDKSSISRYRISQDTGVDAGALSRFHHGTAGLSLDALDRIGQYLNLKVVREEK